MPELLQNGAGITSVTRRTNGGRDAKRKDHTDEDSCGDDSCIAGAMIVPRHVIGGAGYQAPSDTVNIAVVGCGGQGASDAIELVAGGQNIVALADVDFGFVDRAVARRTVGRDGQPNENGIKLQEAYKKAKRYSEYLQREYRKGWIL